MFFDRYLFKIDKILCDKTVRLDYEIYKIDFSLITLNKTIDVWLLFPMNFLDSCLRT